MITQKYLKEILLYEPDTGTFIWKVRAAQRIKVGQNAGSVNGSGYRHIKIKGKFYKAHRLAFLYSIGEFPLNTVDHINGITDDNRWTNLRQATNSQNAANKRKTISNTSGLKGVSWYRLTKSWRSVIKLNGKNKHLGYFKTSQEAHQAYCKAADELYGEFANHG